MKKFLAAVLMLAALLLGLLLPSASMGLLDGQAERDEATELQQVDLVAASGLSTMKKLQLLCDETSTILDVGVAPNQTASTLSSVCWGFLSYYQDMSDFVLLQPETACQESQTALLISGAGGDSAFLLWEVFFDDKAGGRLYLYVDDESGRVLGLHFCPVESMGGEEVWSYFTAALLAQYLGLWAEDTEETENYGDYLSSLFDYVYYDPQDKSAIVGDRESNRPVYEGEAPGLTVLDDEGNSCTFLIDYGEAWFRININR